MLQHSMHGSCESSRKVRLHAIVPLTRSRRAPKEGFHYGSPGAQTQSRRAAARTADRYTHPPTRGVPPPGGLVYCRLPPPLLLLFLSTVRIHEQEGGGHATEALVARSNLGTNERCGLLRRTAFALDALCMCKLGGGAWKLGGTLKYG